MSTGNSTGSSNASSSSALESITRLISDLYHWVTGFFFGDDVEATVLKTTRKVRKFEVLNHYYSPQLKRRRVFMPDLDPREIYILE